MRRNKKKSRIFDKYERNLYVFALSLRNFCMQKYVSQPFKLLYPSRSETYMPTLTQAESAVLTYSSLCLDPDSN